MADDTIHSDREYSLIGARTEEEKVRKYALSFTRPRKHRHENGRKS